MSAHAFISRTGSLRAGSDRVRSAGVASVRSGWAARTGRLGSGRVRWRRGRSGRSPSGRVESGRVGWGWMVGSGLVGSHAPPLRSGRVRAARARWRRGVSCRVGVGETGKVELRNCVASGSSHRAGYFLDQTPLLGVSLPPTHAGRIAFQTWSEPSAHQGTRTVKPHPTPHLPPSSSLGCRAALHDR